MAIAKHRTNTLSLRLTWSQLLIVEHAIDEEVYYNQALMSTNKEYEASFKVAQAVQEKVKNLLQDRG